MKKFSCTLNRAHAIAQRLKGMLAETGKRATERLAYAHASLRDQGNSIQEEKFNRNRMEGVEALFLWGKINNTLTALRQAIGKANIETGVGDLLAKQDGLNRRLQLLRSITAQRSDDSVEPSQLALIQAPSADRFHSVTVDVLGAEARADVEAEIKAIEREIYQIADHIAEKNLTRITFSIDERIAEEAGLKD